jgi:hypothetical protein
MATLTERMIGAAMLDAKTYESVEADPSATAQAMTVVALAAVAAGIGSLRYGVGVVGISLVAAFVGWFIWAGLTYVIGTKVLPEPQTQADFGQLLRVIGFSAAPGVLAVLGIVPLLGGVVTLLAGLWQLAAMVVGVRQALDYTSTGRAIGVCVIGFVVYWLVNALFLSAFLGTAMLAGAMGR